MTPERKKHLLAVYKNGLLDDTIPFWRRNGVDREYGGYITCLDRDGSVLQTDKSMWFQGRFAWMLSTLYNTVERRPEWLEDAKSGIDFLEKHGFDDDGRMFFAVTREGRPLRKRRYLFSEAFAVIAFAAYANATNDDTYRKKALDLFHLILHYHKTPGLLEPKSDQTTRPAKGLAMPMILTATAQELRLAVDDPICNQVIDESIAEIENHHMKPEFKCLLEQVGPNGEFYDTLDGRTVNPGHSLEAGWFILDEARHRNNDPRLKELGLKIIDWSLKWGWDEPYGGVLYFRDCRNLSPTEYWQDMKFWWPQNESIIATLLAYEMTGDPQYARWHEMCHDWTYAHFPDPLYGDWYGYLHRDGTVSTPVKGTMWKGPFHLPRMQWFCWKTLERMGVTE